MSSVKYVGPIVNQIIKGAFVEVRLLKKNTLKINSVSTFIAEEAREIPSPMLHFTRTKVHRTVSIRNS